MSEEEYFKKYHKHIIFGGCCVSEDNPEWACSKCSAYIYNVKHIPFTKKDAYTKLDAMLSEEHKEALKTNDAIKYHFSLGLWIRNNWIYGQNEEYAKHLAELFGEAPDFFHADDLSDRIIRSYKRHLNGIKEKVQEK